MGLALLQCFFVKDLFKTMNEFVMLRMNKNSDMARSSPLDFSQVMKIRCIMGAYVVLFCALLLVLL
jgi:hypothetical protein